MYKKITPTQLGNMVTFPHCDARILHAPGECRFCDEQPLWQYLRQIWGIAFTGYIPEENELPCPADNARGEEHQKWNGNLAQPPVFAEISKTEPCMYGPFTTTPYFGDFPGLGGTTGGTPWGGMNVHIVNTQAGQNQASTPGPVTEG